MAKIRIFLIFVNCDTDNKCIQRIRCTLNDFKMIYENNLSRRSAHLIKSRYAQKPFFKILKCDLFHRISERFNVD